MSFAETTLLGHLADDATVRRMKNDTKVANFRVITNFRWRDRKTKEIREKVTGHNIEAFGPICNVIEERGVKGAKVFIKGRPDDQKYESNGQTRFIHKVTASLVQFHSPKPEIREDEKIELLEDYLDGPPSAPDGFEDYGEDFV